MSMVVGSTKDVSNNWNLELIAGEAELDKEITTSDISKPGIEMTGYFKYYPKERIQLIGSTEMSYFLELPEAEQKHRIERLFSDDTQGVVIARDRKSVV